MPNPQQQNPATNTTLKLEEPEKTMLQSLIDSIKKSNDAVAILAKEVDELSQSASKPESLPVKKAVENHLMILGKLRDPELDKDAKGKARVWPFDAEKK